MTDLLTTSRLSAARACARLHRHRFEDGFRPAVEPEPKRFGALVHRGLELWWCACGETSSARLTAALSECYRADPYDAARAEAMLRGYDARWGAEPFSVQGVEVEFRAPLVNPSTGASSRTWELAGKIDAIVSDADGRVWIVEHKTSSEDISQGSEYWQRLNMDGQISMYYAGAKALGYDVAGCIYDVLGKPKLRPYEATPQDKRKYRQDGMPYKDTRLRDETPAEYLVRLCAAIAAEPDRYYQRGTVVRLEAEMREAMIDVWQIGRTIRDNQLAGHAPRNPDSCVRWGRTCEFFGVCTGTESLEDPTKFVRSVPFPELSTRDVDRARAPADAVVCGENHA